MTLITDWWLDSSQVGLNQWELRCLLRLSSCTPSFQLSVLILAVHHESETGWFSPERHVVWSHHGIQSYTGLRSLNDQSLQDFQALKEDRETKCSCNSLLSALTSNPITDKLGLIIRSASKWIFLSSFLYYSSLTFFTWSLWSYSCIENNTIKSGMSSLQSSITL